MSRFTELRPPPELVEAIQASGNMTAPASASTASDITGPNVPRAIRNRLAYGEPTSLSDEQQEGQPGMLEEEQDASPRGGALRTRDAAGGVQVAGRGADTSTFLADPVVRRDHMMEVQKAHTSAVRNERDFLPAGSPGARRQGDLSVQGSANIMGNDRHSYKKGPHYKATNMHHKQTNKPGQS